MVKHKKKTFRRMESFDKNVSSKNTNSTRTDIDDRKDSSGNLAGKADVSTEDFDNSSIKGPSEQEQSRKEPTVLSSGNVGSTDDRPSTTLDSNASYDVEDAGASFRHMNLDQANSPNSSLNDSYAKDLYDSRNSGKNTNRSSYNHNQNSGNYKNDRHKNIQSNWRNNGENSNGDTRERSRTSNAAADYLRPGPKGSSNSFSNGSRSSNSFSNGSRSSRYERSENYSKNHSRTSFNSSKDSSYFQDSPKERSRTSFGNYRKRDVFYNVSDEEKNEFVNYLDSTHADNFKIVQEEERDLFGVGSTYALAHCVAEDMNMGSGIAVEFRSRYKKISELLDQNVGTGGLAFLNVKGQFVYYLVTKAISQGKPTYDTLWSSLIELRKHIKTNQVKKLALPRIGCGLDRLDWNVVKPMLEFIFRDEDLEILVCNLQVDGPSTTPLVKRSKVIFSTKAVTEIESETLILYFASKDGKPTDVMKSLDEKFKFVNHFQRAPKNLGEVFRYASNVPKNYILYGCIVKNTENEPFSFNAFDKCLRAIKKNYKTDNFFYAAFQKTSDEILDAKILNLMKHSLSDLEIHICGYSVPNLNVEE